jgi:hypothetical protein
MIRRGDVIMVDFPFTDTGQSKVRPAVVVQGHLSDLLRTRLDDCLKPALGL